MPGTIPSDVVTLIQSITNEIINPIIGVIFAAALVYFLWGLMIFIVNSGDSAKRAEGKRHIVWGLIGMVVMLSVITILEIGLRTIGVSPTDVPNEIPVFK
jgi:hypothetical protein